MIREFYRVGYEIVQDLPNSLGVTQIDRGAIVFEGDVERNALLSGDGGKRISRAPGDLLQIKRFGLQIQFTGFDLRQVQRVIQNGNQRLTGRQNSVQSFSL